MSTVIKDAAFLADFLEVQKWLYLILLSFLSPTILFNPSSYRISGWMQFDWIMVMVNLWVLSSNEMYYVLHNEAIKLVLMIILCLIFKIFLFRRNWQIVLFRGDTCTSSMWVLTNCNTTLFFNQWGWFPPHSYHSAKLFQYSDTKFVHEINQKQDINVFVIVWNSRYISKEKPRYEWLKEYHVHKKFISTKATINCLC